MQSHRLANGGHIDRNETVFFTFNGRLLEAYAGDSLASALLANNISLVARSLKYHRPRGIVSAGLEEASALVSCSDEKGVFVPNLKVTEVLIKKGLEARSQNCWPNVNLDIGALLQQASAILSAGFYYKTFMWPPDWWYRLYEKLIRRVAGQGRASIHQDNKIYDKRVAHCELLIIGSGPTGLAAAMAAADSGVSVILLEQDHLAGGSSLWEQVGIDSPTIAQWRRSTLELIERQENIRIMLNTLAFGQYDHGQILAVEKTTGDTDSILWRIRARRILLACGATERPAVFPHNDRPGIMLAAAVRQYIYRYAVVPGRRALLVIADPVERESTRQALDHAGIEIVAALQQGERIIATRGVHRLSRVVYIDRGGKRHSLSCDLLCMSAGWNPNAQLVAQLGTSFAFDTRANALLPSAQVGLTLSSGACRGLSSINDCITDGHRQALRAIAQIKSKTPAEDKLPVIPAAGNTPTYHDGRGKAFVDLQNDVTRADLELAVHEGYQHVELVKRYTTLGMGTDQGKTSWLNALLELMRLTGKDAATIGHTTFRPPYSPVNIGALVGADTGQHMTPLRHTPFHRVFSAADCIFQTSGDWIYSRYFPQVNESMEQAIQREVLAVRNAVGCVDMSTLGKVDIKGSDALEFLSRVYCNNIETIQPGRLRYVLMLREDGIVFDDGTAAQLGQDHYLVTMTTANAAASWRWMNKLLQLHWPELDVQLTSVSDHWASLAIAGPQSRELLQALNPDFDVTRAHFPFASVREGLLDRQIPCRVFSISFSGELSYEINVPAGFASTLYQWVIERGAGFGITPYGLEALDVLRIEKGHLSVGTEIDGRTTPADLGLGKMVSTRKAFIGSSLLQRPALNQSGRLQLVGLTSADGHSSIPVAAHLCEQPWQPGVTRPSRGKLTAAITSPTLQRPLALALLHNGHQRLDEKLWAVSPLTQQSVKVVIGPSCFFDPQGSRVND